MAFFRHRFAIRYIYLAFWHYYLMNVILISHATFIYIWFRFRKKAPISRLASPGFARAAFYRLIIASLFADISYICSSLFSLPDIGKRYFTAISFKAPRRHALAYFDIDDTQYFIFGNLFRYFSAAHELWLFTDALFLRYGYFAYFTIISFLAFDSWILFLFSFSCSRIRLSTPRIPPLYHWFFEAFHIYLYAFGDIFFISFAYRAANNTYCDSISFSAFLCQRPRAY